MNNNSDPLFTQYADMDFADAKPVSEVPALAKLQAAQGGAADAFSLHSVLICRNPTRL